MKNVEIMLINGATGGMGKGCAEHFIAKGYSLILLGRDKEKLNLLKTALENKKHAGQFIKTYELDLENQDDISSVIKSIKSENIAPTYFLNASGIVIRGNLHEVKHNEWQQAININLLGVISLISGITEIMKSQNKSGAIVLINGILSRQPDPGLVINSTITGAISNYAKAISKELGKYKIRMNIINPGVTRTPLYERIKKEISNELNITEESVENIMSSKSPYNRIGEISDIVHAVDFLCSKKSEFINGIFVNIDGGSSNAY